MKIISIPMINGLGKTIGCDRAFDSIFDSLKNIYSNEEGKPFDIDLLNVEKIKIDYDNFEASNRLIYDKAFRIFGNEGVLFIGGDHCISYSLVRAFFDKCESLGKEPCLIIFDAHPDCMEAMPEPTHEEWLRKLVEDGFPSRNILIVGLRNIWKDEFNFLKEKGIRAINANRFLGNIEEACDTMMEFASGKELYVSIDIDVVDPVFAPGTNYKEVGGFTSRQFIYFISRIRKMKNLRAVDLVEINPEKDKDNLTVNLGAKIISELV
jgi:arginase family enzyme